MGKYNQIMNKKRMTVDEAIDIIDEMYQDKMKQIEENNTIYADKIENIEFTNLEFAGVILLREVQSLRRKLENSIPKKKIKDEIEELKEIKDKYAVGNTNYINELQYAIETLQDLLEG